MPVFRYAAGYDAGEMPTVTYGGVERTLTIHPAPGALPGGATEETYAAGYQSVTTVTGEGGETFSYVAEGTEPNLYLVEKTGERFGGTFSAPTALAVELAKDCGLTLAAFCRRGRANVYSHPERLIGL